MKSPIFDGCFETEDFKEMLVIYWGVIWPMFWFITKFAVADMIHIDDGYFSIIRFIDLKSILGKYRLINQLSRLIVTPPSFTQSVL